MQNHKFIVIEGNIGAGKSTLSKKIAKDFGAKLILEEFSDNSFLPKFYKNPERFAFPLELSFLADRFTQLQEELSNLELFNNLIVSDYYFMKSLIFAKNTLNRDEYKLYQKLFNIIYPSLPKPDLYVYLHRPTDRLMENIKKRGREYEQEITKQYLNSVQEGYFNYFKLYQEEYKFLILDAEKVDFINNPKEYEKITNLIFDANYEIGINRRFASINA